MPVIAGIPFGCGCFTVFVSFHLPRHSILPALVELPFLLPCTNTFLIQLSSILYLLDVYGPEFGASALAATGILRFSFSGAFPLFTLQMYQKLGIHWAGSVFGFIALAMLPVPWVFFKWGKELRRRSKFVPVLDLKN